MSQNWVKLVSPEETSWTKVSLENVHHVDGLKKVIKRKKPNSFKDHGTVQLILRAKKSSESDEQVMELVNPRESITSVQQRFGDDFRVLVSTTIHTHRNTNKKHRTGRITTTHIDSERTLPRLPPEIQHMIAEKALQSLNKVLENTISFSQVCKAWNDSVKLIIRHNDLVGLRLLKFVTRTDDITRVDDFMGKYKVNVNAADHSGRTVLHDVCSGGNVNLFKHLVHKYGALEGKDQEFVTDLSLAAASMYRRTMWRTLINEYGAKMHR